VSDLTNEKIIMKRQGHAALISLVLAGFIVSVMVSSASASIKPATSKDSPTKVLVFMQEGNQAFRERIELDDRLQLDYEYADSLSHIRDLNNYQVFVVCGYLPQNLTYIQYLIANVTAGAGKGLFIWGGFYPIFADSQYKAFKDILPVVFKEPFTVEEELYLDQGWVGQIELKVNSNYLWNDGIVDPASVNLLQRSVVWESSPLVKERIFVKDANVTAKVLVYRPEQGRTGTFSLGEPLVAYDTVGTGRVLWVSMVVGATTAQFAEYITQGAGPYWERVIIPGSQTPHGVEANKPFYLWPYFNYFLFQSVRFLAGDLSIAAIDTYAQWPFSPIPHETEATLWMVFVAGLWVFNFVLFFTLGRKKKTAGREVVAPGSATGGEKELTAEERKALETAKTEGKALITEEKKPSEDEKK
jgi:hypothetical protein